MTGKIQLINDEGQDLYKNRGYVYYSDTSFIVGDSPIVLDIKTDLGRDGVNGWIRCDGSGNILVEISNNGTDYGTQYTLKSGEAENILGDRVSKIRLTHSGTDSAYRIRMI